MATTPSGLIVYYLEIGKALAEHDRAILHAKGMCMYPLVRPGDRLHIQSRSVEQVNVGEIAVSRREGRLVCHRVVDKGILNGRAYIVTRSDRNKQNNDPFTYDEDLLGIVTSIERNGHPINPYDNRRNRLSRFYSAALRTLTESFYSWRGPIVVVLSAIQRAPIYQSGSRLLTAFSNRTIRFEVRVWKKSWKKLDLYLPQEPDEFDLSGPEFQGSSPDGWTLVLHLNKNQKPAVQATFQSDSERWYLKDLHIRSRYRGMGLGKDLLLKAEEIFRRSGITNFETDGASLE